jgi:hypothetical protein
MAKHITSVTGPARSKLLHQARAEELAARKLRRSQEASERTKAVINHGYALKAFSERVDLQLTALAAAVADVKRMLAAKAKEPA